MLIKELHVQVENKPGQLHKTLKIIGDEKIDIWALSCDRISNEKTVVRMLTSDNDRACSTFEKNSIPVECKEVVIVDISDSPGELANVCELIYKNNINVESVYASVTYITKRALAIFTFDNNAAAMKVIQDSHLTLVTDQTIKDAYREDTYYKERSIKEYFSNIITP